MFNFPIMFKHEILDVLYLVTSNPQVINKSSAKAITLVRLLNFKFKSELYITFQKSELQQDP